MSIKEHVKKQLDEEIKQCHRCPGMNVRGITENAPGYGDINSTIMLVGQSLCHKCIESQIPFTGGSGVLLDRIFYKVGINNRDIFITNVIHCHPPHNRPSYSYEIRNCRYFLKKEIEIVKPKIIIALGKDAMQWFLEKVNLREVLYKLILWKGFYIYPVHHPSYVMKKGDRVKKYFEKNLIKIMERWK